MGGGIPLPALDVKNTYTPQSALEEYGRAAALKTQSQQQQLQQQQIEAQHQQLADQKAMTGAMQEWDGKNIEELPAIVLKKGGSANAVFNVKNQILEHKQKLASLDKATLDTMAAHHDAALGALDAAKGLPDDQLPQHLSQTADELAQQGHIDLPHAQMLHQMAQTMPPADLRSHLDIFEKGLMGEKEQFAQVEAQKKAAVNQQEANAKDWKEFPTMGVALNTKTGEQKSIGTGQTLPPAMLESKYFDEDLKRRRGQPFDKDFIKTYEHMKTLVPVANLNMQAALLTPQAKEMSAQFYQQTGQLPAGMRSPAMSAGILNQAAGAPGGGVPDIAGAKRTYAAQTALQKSATSGDIAKNVTAYNTAIAHAGQLREAADALDNGDVRALNALGNKLGYEFGSDKTTNFNVIKNALSGEISKVFKGGEATDAEIKAVQEPFSAANSPKQLKGAIENAIHLMNSKRDALKQQYEQGMQGKPNFEGGASTAMPTATGPNGHKIVVRDGRWVDAQTGAPVQ